ncbi:MAG TPA: hypothetical protein VGQ08_13280 [Nitrospiraceae bacterium]|jgi:hypothetical protein|nr:hypothetical protein [Nitrospiraceae bacterium]
MTEGERIRGEISALWCVLIVLTNVPLTDDQVRAARDAVRRRHPHYSAEAFEAVIKGVLEQLEEEVDRYMVERMAWISDHPEWNKGVVHGS